MIQIDAALETFGLSKSLHPFLADAPHLGAPRVKNRFVLALLEWRLSSVVRRAKGWVDGVSSF